LRGVVVLVVVFVVGFVCGYLAATWAPRGGVGGGVSVGAGLAEPLHLINTSLGETWGAMLNITMTPRGLSHPAPVERVDVYVRVRSTAGGRPVWLRAESSWNGAVMGQALTAIVTGDHLLLPGSPGHLEVTILSPGDEKPLEAVVAVTIRGVGTLYIGPVSLAGRR